MATPNRGLAFGPGGIPNSTKTVTTSDGKKLDGRRSAIYRLKELDLDHMEVEFVHGVNITEESALALGKLARENNTSLTVHGPYYINLASLEKPKIYASINRIKKTLQAAEWMDAKSITFHAAFYQDRDPKEITKQVIEAAHKIYEEIPQAVKEKILFSPETTGKPSQWGTVDEILDAADAINQKEGRFTASICVDFAHLYARSVGKVNSYEDFISVLDKIEKKLGKEALQQLHMHISGIEYSEKGERKHFNLKEAKLDYKATLKALKEKEVSGWLTCESPNLEEDAKLLKETYLGFQT